MSRSQRKAVVLNNKAAYLIETGEFDTASDKLTLALNIAHTALESKDNRHPREPLHTSIDQWMSSTTDDDDESVDDQQRQRYIYRSPIYIPNSSEGTDGLGVLTSIVAIFNLALANHLPCLKLDSDARILQLTKSKRLYELAFNLQRQTSDCCNIIFTMAVINNLGAIHKELNDDETAGKCFEHVLSTLMFAIDCGDENVSELCDGFIRNTAHLYSQQCTAAAA